MRRPRTKRSPPAMPLSLGSLRYRGICPPSNPGLVPLPDRDFWPRMPKPQVPPCRLARSHARRHQVCRSVSCPAHLKRPPVARLLPGVFSGLPGRAAALHFPEGSVNTLPERQLLASQQPNIPATTQQSLHKSANACLSGVQLTPALLHNRDPCASPSCANQAAVPGCVAEGAPAPAQQQRRTGAGCWPWGSSQV
jgi:hypothetical protein